MVQFDNCVNYFKALILDELSGIEENSDITDKGIIHVAVVGGAVRDYFLGELNSGTDIDLMFRTEKDYQKALLFFKQLKKILPIKEDNHGTKLKYNGRTYDLIANFYYGRKGHFIELQEAINRFDFTVAMFACDSEGVYHGDTSFIDLAKKQLMINKLEFPERSVYRAFKYIAKGYRICHAESAKLINAVKSSKAAKLNEEEISVYQFKGID